MTEYTQEWTPESPVQDVIVNFGEVKLGVKRLEYLPMTLYVWIKLSKPSKSALKILRDEIDKLSGVRLIANVEPKNETACRFVKWYKFDLIGKSQGKLVYERWT